MAQAPLDHIVPRLRPIDSVLTRFSSVRAANPQEDPVVLALLVLASEVQALAHAVEDVMEESG